MAVVANRIPDSQSQPALGERWKANQHTSPGSTASSSGLHRLGQPSLLRARPHRRRTRASVTERTAPSRPSVGRSSRRTGRGQKPDSLGPGRSAGTAGVTRPRPSAPLCAEGARSVRPRPPYVLSGGVGPDTCAGDRAGDGYVTAKTPKWVDLNKYFLSWDFKSYFLLFFAE